MPVVPGRVPVVVFVVVVVVAADAPISAWQTTSDTSSGLMRPPSSGASPPAAAALRVLDALVRGGGRDGCCTGRNGCSGCNADDMSGGVSAWRAGASFAGGGGRSCLTARLTSAPPPQLPTPRAVP